MDCQNYIAMYLCSPIRKKVRRARKIGYIFVPYFFYFS